MSGVSLAGTKASYGCLVQSYHIVFSVVYYSDTVVCLETNCIEEYSFFLWVRVSVFESEIVLEILLMQLDFECEVW